MSDSKQKKRVYVSSDAQLGLERLIVGRRCNSFDLLSPARKSRAYAELIRLGLIYGEVAEIAGQDYPSVKVVRVSSRGRQMHKSFARTKTPMNQNLKLAIIIGIVVVSLIGCLITLNRCNNV